MRGKGDPGSMLLVSFASRGRIGLIKPDGTGERYLEFDIPGQVSWQVGPQFSDGRRVILLSIEEGKAWEGKVQTHLWIYDLFSQALTAIATKDRPAPFMTCSTLLPGEERMVVGPVIDGEQRIFTMNLDGSDQVALTQRGEGFAYCVELSPDATCLAFHVTGPGDLPYRINVMGLDGRERVTVAHQPDHLYFGPTWSPDGKWLLYQDCHFRVDPGHDWSDLCLGRPDGSEHRVITQGLRQWFGTSYGSPETRGGGSELPQWSPDGLVVTYTRALPGSKTAWEFQPQRPDTDHFNRDYKPDEARGGTEICLLNPFRGEAQQLSHNDPPLWDFRARFSPDGERLLFSRAAVGCPCEVWMMDTDGSNQRFLTRGYQGMGADHARWLVVGEW